MGQKIHPLGFRLGITQKHRAQWYAKPNDYSYFLQEDQLIRNFLSEQLSGSQSQKAVSAATKSNVPASGAGGPNSQSAKSPKGALFGDAGLSKTLVSRRADRLFVEVHVAQPKIVTGEGGVRLKELTLGIQKIQENQRLRLRRLPFPNGETPGGSSHDGVAGEAPVATEVNVPSVSPSVSFQVVQVAQPATDATLLAQSIAQQLEKRVAFRRVMKLSIQKAREVGVEGIKIQISGRLNGAEIARREWAREGRVPLHTLRADIDYASFPAQTIYGLLGIKIWIFKSSDCA
jgi:small subunit ribosomal protein S3